MSQAALELLLKLLRRAERGGTPAPVLPVTERFAPEYFASEARERERLHALLQNAEATGAVALEWGRYEAKRDLVRIRLRDPDRLAAFLGTERVADKVRRIERRVRPRLKDAPEWLSQAFELALAKWRHLDKPFGCSADQVEDIEQLFRAAAAVAREEHQGLDLRRFSALTLGDSKAVERVQGRLAALLRRNPELADLESNQALFRTLGLEKFPPPLFIKGGLRLCYGGVWLDLGPLRPFLALSPDGITAVEFLAQPPYVLTVENMASFQRHVREIDDPGLVIYTAGFPGPMLRGFIENLDQRLPPQVGFYHWGDVDLGGARIFERLSAILNHRVLQPHLMDGVAGVEEEPFSPSQRKALSDLAERGGSLGTLVNGWLARKVSAGEQERVDPQAPVGPAEP